MSDSSSIPSPSPSSSPSSVCAPAKIEANRANARKSTGPRIAQGKRVSSLTAQSHGIFAADVMPGEDRAEYALLHFELVHRFLPQDRMEMSIVERIVQSGLAPASGAASHAPPSRDEGGEDDHEVQG